VKKNACIAALCVAAALVLSCQKKEPSARPVPAPEPVMVRFVAPADSAVTADQMQKWIVCNTYLDSLAVLYKDSFPSGDPAKQTAAQDRFARDEDRLCVRLGLPGGYEEYLWILRCLGNSKNKRMADSLKLATYR
jgi:hypothetical protein